MNKLTSLLNKAKSLPINIKAMLITVFVVIVLIIAIVLLVRSNNNANNQIEIEKLKPQIETAKTEAKQKANELKNSVTNHNKSVQDKVKQINKHSEVKPFKPMKHEIIKVKSASYNHMHNVLDTIQPIK